MEPSETLILEAMRGGAFTNRQKAIDALTRINSAYNEAFSATLELSEVTKDPFVGDLITQSIQMCHGISGTFLLMLVASMNEQKKETLQTT